MTDKTIAIGYVRASSGPPSGSRRPRSPFWFGLFCGMVLGNLIGFAVIYLYILFVRT